jgi:hypothetical protein
MGLCKSEEQTTGLMELDLVNSSMEIFVFATSTSHLATGEAFCARCGQYERAGLLRCSNEDPNLCCQGYGSLLVGGKAPLKVFGRPFFSEISRVLALHTC